MMRSAIVQEPGFVQDSCGSINPAPARIRPFLKWAGGKRQLLPHLRRFTPAGFGRYLEPFLGSAALFFDLYGRGKIGDRPIVLADNNADLVGCYKAVATDVEDVIRELQKLAAGHAVGKERHYYGVRDNRFNPWRRRLVARRRHRPIEYPPELAAMFIYLNRTGFNGLYRLNARGDFNVPVGRYANPQICDAANLRAVAVAFQSPNVELRQSGFEIVLDECQSGDFLYFDPPYAPLSSTSSFTSYTAARFTDADQRRLQQVIIELAHRGCSVLLSNSTAQIITDLFDQNPEARRAGLRAFRILARRSINSNASRRGEIAEYIITNLLPSD